MGAYQTRQKMALMEFFQKHRQHAYTIEEILSLLQNEPSDGPKLGRSTVYRLVPEFVAEGALRRFFKVGERSSRYQYVGDPDCARHLHLKCTRCGALFHLTRSLSDEIFRGIWESVHLSLNTEETMLLGTCEQCKK